MTATAKTPTLLGLPGSLRRESYAKAVLAGLQAELAPAIRLEIGSIDLPLYNQDLDGHAPLPAVDAFRQAIAEADAVVIVSPEYNYGMPGPLKNALDWASRPYGKAALIGKPTLVISSSPAFTGGVRAQDQIHGTLLAIGARLVGGPQIVIGAVADKIADGKLVDRASLDFAAAAVRRLVEIR